MYNKLMFKSFKYYATYNIMPFHRNIERKAIKRYGQYKKCAGYVAHDASKALAMAKYLKGIVNVEFKNHTVTATAAAISATPSLTQTTNMSLGDTTNDRDGSNIKLVSLTFSYTLVIHASAVDTLVRVMVIHDKQTNQAAFTAANILNDVTSEDSIVSPRNLDHTHRFQVFYDKVHALSDAGPKNVYRSFNRKLQLKLRYDANDGTIADLTSSSLALLFVSNEATNTPLITFTHRLRFVDN